MPRTTAHRARRGRGFTLIELTVVIAIIAILAGALLPVIIDPLRIQRNNTMQTQMAELHEAIAGRPEVGDYGFLGTVGSLPEAQNLVEVVVNTKQGGGAWQPAALSNGVVTGWNGPYLHPTTYDPLVDAWGTAYELDFNPNDTTQWRLRSAGQDRVFGPGDDVYYPQPYPPGVGTTPIYWPSVARTLQLTVDEAAGTWVQPLVNVGATIYWPNPAGGPDFSLGATTDAAGVASFTFASPYVPLGMRHVQINIDGSITDRTVVLDAESATGRVTVPLPSATSQLTCVIPSVSTTPTAGSPARLTLSCSGGAGGTLAVPQGTVVEVDFTGTLGAPAGSGSGGCFLSTQLNTLDVVNPLDGATQAANGVAKSEAVGSNLPVTSDRFQTAGSAITVAPVLVFSGGVATKCQVSYGVATVKAYRP